MRAQASGALASTLAAQVNARQAEVRLGQLIYLIENGGDDVCLAAVA